MSIHDLLGTDSAALLELEEPRVLPLPEEHARMSAVEARVGAARLQRVAEALSVETYETEA